MSTNARSFDAVLSDPRLRKLLRELYEASEVERPALLMKVRELWAQLAAEEEYDAFLLTWAKTFGLLADTANQRSLILVEARAEAESAKKAGAVAEPEPPTVIEEDESLRP